MRRCILLVIAVALIALTYWGALAMATAADKDPQPKKSQAAEIAEAWTPKGKGEGSAHRIGAGIPKDSPKLVAMSFRSSQMTFAEAWAFCAEKCGYEEKFSENTIVVTNGENKRGSWLLVERPGQGLKRVESLFSFRCEAYSVSVTLRPEDGWKAVSGTITVVLH